MKITYTIWIADNWHHTAECEIECYNLGEIREDFEKAIELRRLQIENYRLRKAKEESI